MTQKVTLVQKIKVCSEKINFDPKKNNFDPNNGIIYDPKNVIMIRKSYFDKKCNSDPENLILIRKTY